MSETSLRDVMCAFPQGVVVVTAPDTPNGDGPRGITVSSFMSVSLAPPTVLVSIMQTSRTHDLIDAGRFVVNVLSDRQGEVSDHFANPDLSSAQHFQGRVSSHRFGSDTPPALDGCLGYLLCKVVERVPLADHTLFIGEVEKADLGEEGTPLIFCSRRYWGLGSNAYERTSSR